MNTRHDIDEDLDIAGPMAPRSTAETSTNLTKHLGEKTLSKNLAKQSVENNLDNNPGSSRPEEPKAMLDGDV